MSAGHVPTKASIDGDSVLIVVRSCLFFLPRLYLDCDFLITFFPPGRSTLFDVSTANGNAAGNGDF